MHTRTQTRTHRLIPTHAGKTGPNAGVWSVSWAHPHSRGENDNLVGDAGRVQGSSPLTRGKHGLGLGLVGGQGLIPTHAGKTPWGGGRGWPGGAHPHSRGENAGGRVSRVGARGSSPLTRGKPRRRNMASVKAGLIPTHAGKTRRCAAATWFATAHPHSRGENAGIAVEGSRRLGSSPLTRGKHH